MKKVFEETDNTKLVNVEKDINENKLLSEKEQNKIKKHPVLNGILSIIVFFEILFIISPFTLILAIFGMFFDFFSFYPVIIPIIIAIISFICEREKALIIHIIIIIVSGLMYLYIV